MRESDGTAGVWLARPASEREERELAQSMRAARAFEYEALHQQAVAAAPLVGSQRARAIRSLRGELRRIRRRDFFPPSERDAAVAAVEALARDEASGRTAVEPRGPARTDQGETLPGPGAGTARGGGRS